jgi:solute:Na+ symporter, SSS family
VVKLFNTFIALSLHTIPLIGLGVVTMSLFWTNNLNTQVGDASAGFKLLDEPAHAWGELIKACHLPVGLTGVLVATELAAFMSAVSSLLNWGSSFIINDFYKPLNPNLSPKKETNVSRITTLLMFVFAAIVAILFVHGMVSWFLFINSVMVMFLLPLSWFRFFWWRFNVWGGGTFCNNTSVMSIVN